MVWPAHGFIFHRTHVMTFVHILVQTLDSMNGCDHFRTDVASEHIGDGVVHHIRCPSAHFREHVFTDYRVHLLQVTCTSIHLCSSKLTLVETMHCIFV